MRTPELSLRQSTERLKNRAAEGRREPSQTAPGLIRVQLQNLLSLAQSPHGQ
jgi:hypothetical protein